MSLSHIKSNYSQIKKREIVYRASCDKAEEKYLAEVFELLKDECNQWGLEFCAGNGVYSFALPSANKHLIKVKAAAGYLQRLNEPGCDLIELICPELFEILEADLHNSRGCCIGCQLLEYTDNFPNNDLVCIQSNELEIDYQETPDGSIVSLESAKETSYGPMKKNLAEAILASESACDYWQLFDEFQVNI